MGLAWMDWYSLQVGGGGGGGKIKISRFPIVLPLDWNRPTFHESVPHVKRAKSYRLFTPEVVTIHA